MKVLSVCLTLALALAIGFALVRGTQPDSSDRSNAAMPNPSGIVEAEDAQNSPAHPTSHRTEAEVEAGGELIDDSTASTKEVASDALEPDGSEKIWRLGEELPPELEPWKQLTRNIPLPDFYGFEVKYGGMSKLDLIGERAKLNSELSRLRLEAVMDRLESGQFLPRKSNMEVDVNGDGLPDEQLGVQFTSSPGGPYVLGLSDPTDSGEEIVRMVWLPWEEYGDIYYLKDEQDWLSGKIKEAP